MRSSIYNVFVPLGKEGRYIVYNTLTTAAFVVDEEGMNAIRAGGEGVTDEELQGTLVDRGILLEDDADEKQMFKVRYNLTKYGPCERATFTILITDECNFACPYCYLRFYGLPKASMTEETSHRVAKFIRNVIVHGGHRELYIVLYGGEPLLNIGNGLEILRTLNPWLKENKVRPNIRIITNGTLITEDAIRSCAPFNSSYQITIDGPREIHDRRRFFRDGSGTYDSIMESLELLKRLEVDHYIRVNLDKENVGYVGDMLDDLKTRFGEGMPIRFYQLLPCNDPRAAHNPSCLAGADIRAIAGAWDLARRKGFEVKLKPITSYVYCESLTAHSFTIGSSGEIYKCWGLIGPQHEVGTIDSEGRLKLNHRYYDIMSQDPLEWDKCKSCKYLPACGGGCISMSYDWHGTYHKGYCPEERYLVEDRVRFEMEGKLPQETSLQGVPPTPKEHRSQ